MESDAGLFIYIAALLASGIPLTISLQAVLLSARLSAESVRHLLNETGAQSILLSKRTERLIAEDVVGLVEAQVVPPYSLFLESSVDSDPGSRPRHDARVNVDENDLNVLILHSSGTTGLPKPIRLAHRYLLGYAACHSFAKDEPVNWPNLSTLPLYHGFGLLAPCLSLSVGMPCVFPPSTIIPAAHSTTELLSTFGVQSLMTVPSILEDMLALPAAADRNRALSSLRGLRFVAVGGGPLGPDAGAALAAAAVPVLNHYGATEIGAIAPIFQPGPEYDYRYLRLRTDLGLQLHPVAETQGDGPRRYKLVGRPFGWGRTFEIQDEIVKRPDAVHVEVRILGRRDDLIVLSNGEKVVPRSLEQALSLDQAIRTAVCVGQGFFELALLVEPSGSMPGGDEAFVDHVWRLVAELNPSLDRHARISSRRAIIVKPAGKTIPRSDKGSVMRREVQTVFEKEICAAYEALELESSSTDVALDVGQLGGSVRKLVEMAMSNKLTANSAWKVDDDLFELGMDSLQAARLARFLNSSVAKACQGVRAHERLTAAFIYQHPSLAALTAALGPLISGEGKSVEQGRDRGSEMRALVDEYVRALDAEDFSTPSSPATTATEGSAVLLTGSTGNLGAHMLGCLAHSKRVSRVICLNRSTTNSNADLRARQEQVNASAGVTLSAPAWEKVTFLAANTQAPALGLTPPQLAQLEATITHIVHLAWPMDFNRQLPSFRPQLNALTALVRLARRAHRARPAVRPRLVLASSIAAARHHGARVVPEAPLADPLAATAMGYAEAKWVCERVLHHAAAAWPRECAPVVVRIGQLSGPERAPGVWKTEEHVPALLRAAQLLSAFPDLRGDFSWLPVDRAASALMDLLFCAEVPEGSVYHLENPVRQPLSALGAFVADELGLKEKCVPFEVWLKRMKATGYAPSLCEFFQNDFQALANGNVILDTTVARRDSPNLRGSGGLSKDLIVEENLISSFEFE
ncbi:putative NRPS-like protein biosynthetic cluster [Neofusicoccum ribis]|uniref:NRPS-like protein biosynthetic cluster n=1 Tax=Neofusicoccum ribis TaxID=45134 RepID=A0ABR3SK97_9PEZI